MAYHLYRFDSLTGLGLGRVVALGLPYHGLYTRIGPSSGTVATVEGEAAIENAPLCDGSFLTLTDQSLPGYADNALLKWRWEKTPAHIPYRAGGTVFPRMPVYAWNINTLRFEWQGYLPQMSNVAAPAISLDSPVLGGWFYRAPSGATWYLGPGTFETWSADALNMTLTARRWIRFGTPLESQSVAVTLADLGQSSTTVGGVDPTSGSVTLMAWSPRGDKALLLIGATVGGGTPTQAFARLGLVEVTLSEAQDGTITAEAELLYGRDAMIGEISATFFDSSPTPAPPPYLTGDARTVSSSASVSDRILGGWYLPDGTLEILKFSKTVQCDIEVTVYDYSDPNARTQITHGETSIAHTLVAGARTLTETLAHEADCTVGYSSEPGPGNPKGVANFEGTITLNGQTLVTAGPTQLTKGSQIEEATNIFSRGYPDQIPEELLKTDRGLATTLHAEWAFLSTGTHTNLDDLDDWLYEHVDDGPMKWQLCPVAETAGVIAHALSVEARYTPFTPLDPMQKAAEGVFLGFLPLGAVTTQNTHATRSGSGHISGRAVLPDDPDYEISTRFPWMDKPLPWRSNGRLYYRAGPWSAYDPLDGTLHEPVQTDEAPRPP
jgi:hypothetical protein